MLRTYGRVGQINGIGGIWVEIDTDTNGFNDEVYLVTLIQCLLLNLGESPFNATSGVPAQQSVMTQVAPDYYVMQTQSQFAPYFASLAIARVQGFSPPTYRVNVVANNGAIISLTVPT